MSDQDDFLIESDDKHLMFFHLLKKFEMFDFQELSSIFIEWKSQNKEQSFGKFLVKKDALTIDQFEKLELLQNFLYMRYADRQFAEMALETGHVSRDEIEYALKGQEEIFKSGRKIKKIGDLLIEYGSIDENLKRELLIQQGRELD